MSFATYEEDTVRKHCGLSPRHEPSGLTVIFWFLFTILVGFGMVFGVETAVSDFNVMQDKVTCLSSLSSTPPPVCAAYGYPTGWALEHGGTK